MATSESPKFNHPTSSIEKITIEIDEIIRQLEIADENENPIERFFKRDELLEEYIRLHTEIDMIRRAGRKAE